METLNRRVLERVGKTLRDFPDLFLLPKHLQNQATRRKYLNRKAPYSNCVFSVDMTGIELIPYTYDGYGLTEDTFKKHYGDWFDKGQILILFNYLYLLSHHPEEYADAFFAILGIPLNKSKLKQLAAALSFLSDKSWERQTSYRLPQHFSRLKEDIRNPIYLLNRIHRSYGHTTATIGEKERGHILFTLTSMVAADTKAEQQLFRELLAEMKPTGERGIGYQQFDLLGFPLSALLDTVPDHKTLMDIIHADFDSLCNDARALEGHTRLPAHLKPHMGKWEAVYFPQDAYRNLPISRILMGKHWEDVNKVDMQDVCTFHEAIQAKKTPYNLFQAAKEYLKGNPQPLQDLESFAYPEYTRQVFACEAQLLIYAYADLLGKDMCKRLVCHFVSAKKLFDIDNFRTLPAFVILCGNTWAKRLYPLAKFISEQPPTLNCPFKYRLLIYKTEDRKLDWYAGIEYAKDFSPSRFQWIVKKDKTRFPLIRPQRQDSTPPFWFQFKPQTNVGALYYMLSVFPLLPHDFGRYCLKTLKSVYRLPQSGNNDYFFSRPVLRTFYLINRLIDKGKWGRYPRLNELRDSPINDKWDYIDENGLAFLALVVRILWDTLQSPDKKVDLNHYYYPQVMYKRILKDLWYELHRMAEFLYKLSLYTDIDSDKDESVLPFVPYMLADAAKRNDLRYVLSRAKPIKGTSKRFPITISEPDSLCIPYTSTSCEWESFFRYFALPLYRDYVMKQLKDNEL